MVTRFIIHFWNYIYDVMLNCKEKIRLQKLFKKIKHSNVTLVYEKNNWIMNMTWNNKTYFMWICINYKISGFKQVFFLIFLFFQFLIKCKWCLIWDVVWCRFEIVIFIRLWWTQIEFPIVFFIKTLFSQK